MTTAEITEELRARLEAELNGIVSSRDMPLYGMMSYHMGWTDSGGGPVSTTIGDRAHGLLCLLACHAAGGDIATALPAAKRIAAVALTITVFIIEILPIPDRSTIGSPIAP